MTLRRAGARRTGNAFEKEQIYREPPPPFTTQRFRTVPIAMSLRKDRSHREDNYA